MYLLNINEMVKTSITKKSSSRTTSCTGNRRELRTNSIESGIHNRPTPKRTFPREQTITGGDPEDRGDTSKTNTRSNNNKCQTMLAIVQLDESADTSPASRSIKQYYKSICNNSAKPNSEPSCNPLPWESTKLRLKATHKKSCRYSCRRSSRFTASSSTQAAT